MPVVICCAARRLDVHRRALQHALERERLIGAGLLAFGQLLDLFVEEALELAAQLLDVAAALGDDVGAARIVEDRQQQVLERQVLVTPAADVIDGALEGLLGARVTAWPSVSLGHDDAAGTTRLVGFVGRLDRELQRKLLRLRECHRLGDLRLGHLERVDPATPTPLLCTWLMIATASFSFLWNTVWSTHTTNSRVV